MKLEKYVQVLNYIGLNPSVNKYQIEKNIKPEIDHSTIHKIISKLKKGRLIETVKTGKSRVGLPVKYYRLSLRGLLAAIAVHSRDIEIYPSRFFGLEEGIDFQELAEKNIELLPLIFKNWNEFKSTGPITLNFHLFSACIGLFFESKHPLVHMRAPLIQDLLAFAEKEPKENAHENDLKMTIWVYNNFFFINESRAPFKDPTRKDIDEASIRIKEINEYVFPRLTRKAVEIVNKLDSVQLRSRRFLEFGEKAGYIYKK